MFDMIRNWYLDWKLGKLEWHTAFSGKVFELETKWGIFKLQRATRRRTRAKRPHHAVAAIAGFSVRSVPDGFRAVKQFDFLPGHDPLLEIKREILFFREPKK